MSNTHTNSPASGNGIIAGLNKLFSPRENKVAENIGTNIITTAGKIGSALTHTVATVTDIPIGVAEGAFEGVNNGIGYVTELADKYIAQNVNAFRAKYFKILTDPLSLFRSRGHARMAGAH